ncbi:MAG: hypothetical protein KAJ35_09165 [Thermoplasmata archaeon]|nr:hypothetical protein [Thermoplasmata archaeon]
MRLDKMVDDEDGDFRIPIFVCPKRRTERIIPKGAVDASYLNHTCDCGYYGKLIVMYTAVVHEDETVDII